MGRIDPPGGQPGRGSVARGNVLFGIAAVLVIAVGAYELGRRSSAPPSPVPVSSVRATPPAKPRPPEPAAATPLSQSTEEALAAFEHARPSPREERSVMEVTVARPEPAPATERPETPHDKMARCLTFRVENDEIHYGGYSPLISPVKVTASNGCSFSFEGPDVSVEVRAVPVHGEGTIVRAVGQFRDPILPRGQSETQMVIACPRCDDVTHRFEVRLLP